MASVCGLRSASLLLLILVILAKNAMLYALLRKTGRAPGIALVGSAFGILGLFFLQPTGFYLWDYFDVLFFTLFLFCVHLHRGNLSFSVLFLFALLNRESALFLPIWLIFDGAELRPRLRFRNRGRLFLGIGLLVFGGFFLHFVRGALIDTETAFATNTNFAAERPCHLCGNVSRAAHAFAHPSWSLNFLQPLLVLLAFAALLVALRRVSAARARLLGLLLVMLASVPVFGLLSETRVYMMFLPFLVFLALVPDEQGRSATE